MNRSALHIEIDDLSSAEITKFLEDHIADMKSVSPPESKHALDIEGLRSPEVTFWSVYLNGELVGCGALKEIDSTHGEVKSMRASPNHRGVGIGRFILANIVEESKKRGYSRVSLETGTMPFFAPARRLYEKFGFVPCGPFAEYKEDPNTVFYEFEIKDI